MLEYLNAPRPEDRPAWRERGGVSYLVIAQAMMLLVGLAMFVSGLYATLLWPGN